MLKSINNAQNSAKPRGHYSQAIVHNGYVYLSGQLGIDPVDQSTEVGSITEQTKNILTSISYILREAGSSVGKIIKVNVYLSNINDWGEVDKVYTEFFMHNKPARIVIPAGGKFHLGFEIAMDAIAYI